MSKLLNKLIANDTIITNISDERLIIEQGLAPIFAMTHNSLQIQKSNLLEQAKLRNWISKAEIFFNRLIEQNIQFIVFKGFAYTYQLYNEKHIRPYCDIDLIINQEDYDSVSLIFSKLNYHCYPSRQGKLISFQNSFFDDSIPQTVFDLHWQISNRIEFHKHFPFNELLKDAITVNTSAYSFKTLCTIDAFIHGCFHFQAHRPSDRKHIWLYDLALLWIQMSNDEQIATLDKANTSQQSSIVSATLYKLKSVFPDHLHITQDLVNQINEPTSHYLNKRDSKFDDILQRFKNIKGLKNKSAFVFGYMFQNRNYVKNQYNLKSNAMVYFYYPKMWLDGIRKLFKKNR